MAARKIRCNVQGLARRSREVVGCIVSDPGYITVSIDLAAGEPTVTSHYSQDANYKYACFDGVGKEPYYDRGVLMLSDIYIQTMSVSPIGRDLVYKAFHQERFDEGRTFCEQWLVNDEVITKKRFKKERPIHKAGCLGLSYGLGPKRMVKSFYEQGYSITLDEARGFFDSYWTLYSGVRDFGKRLEREFARKGYLVNEFGYRLVPDKPFKCLNYFIQSSVSGLVHVFLAKLMAAAPWAHFLTIIHDEVLVAVPIDRLDEFRKIKEWATDSLNDDLKWSVSVRTGFVSGRSWLEAK